MQCAHAIIEPAAPSNTFLSAHNGRATQNPNTCTVCACHQRPGAFKHVSLSTQRQSGAKPEHMHSAHAISDGTTQSSQIRPLPKADPCRFHPTDVHQTDAASFKRDALHMCIGHGTKRRIRRCIPCMCMCICICMWMWMWMWMCAQRTRAVRAHIT
jgi:hypothetical protein